MSSSESPASSPSTDLKRAISSGNFISKLWIMLNDADTNNLIRWSGDGRAICIPDVAAFSKDILPQYFKHSNWPSFIRQLNLYGFRRVNVPDPSAGNEPRQTYYFMNENFIRDESELLGRIKRRSSVRVSHDEKSPETRQGRRSSSSSRRGSDDRERSNDYVEFTSNPEAAEARILQLNQMVKDTEERCSNLANEAVELRSIYNKQQELLSTLLESVRTMSSIASPNSERTDLLAQAVQQQSQLVNNNNNNNSGHLDGNGAFIPLSPVPSAPVLSLPEPILTSTSTTNKTSLSVDTHNNNDDKTLHAGYDGLSVPVTLANHQTQQSISTEPGGHRHQPSANPRLEQQPQPPLRIVEAKSKAQGQLSSILNSMMVTGDDADTLPPLKKARD